MQFIDKIGKLKTSLKNMGFKVYTPAKEEGGTGYSRLKAKDQIELKQGFIDDHIAKIKKSDAVLIANYTKNGIVDYIGANTFLEIGFAYILKKKIFILNSISEQPNNSEIKALKPITLKGNLNII